MADDTKPFESWGCLELLGHLRLAGRVSEQVIAGTALLRIDIPPVHDEHGKVLIDGFTRFFGGGSVYSFTPTSEDVAKRLARNLAHKPIQAYDLMTPTERQQYRLQLDRAIVGDDEPDDDHPF